MQKAFLDILYSRKHLIETEIKEREDRRNNPKTYCKKCESDCDENKAALNIRQMEFNAINTLIQQYIDLHK